MDYYDSIQLTAFNLHWTIEILLAMAMMTKKGENTHIKFIRVVRVENCAHLKYMYIHIGYRFQTSQTHAHIHSEREQQQTMTYWVRLKKILSFVSYEFRSLFVYWVCTHACMHTHTHTQWVVHSLTHSLTASFHFTICICIFNCLHVEFTHIHTQLCQSLLTRADEKTEIYMKIRPSRKRKRIHSHTYTHIWVFNIRHCSWTVSVIQMFSYSRNNSRTHIHRQQK